MSDVKWTVRTLSLEHMGSIWACDINWESAAHGYLILREWMRSWSKRTQREKNGPGPVQRNIARGIGKRFRGEWPEKLAGYQEGTRNQRKKFPEHGHSVKYCWKTDKSKVAKITGFGNIKVIGTYTE